MVTAVLESQMLLDPPTLLITMLLVLLLTSSSYVIVWLQDRRETALLWMTASALLGATFFASRVLLPLVPAIMIANTGVFAGIGCTWMACRAIDGRRPLLWTFFIPTAIWLGLCCVPGFIAQSSVRVAAADLVAASLFGLSIRELWRPGGGHSVARWWVLGVLAAQALGCLGRAAQAILLPAPSQTDIELIQGFAPMALSVLGFMLLMSFGMVALVKERSERRYKQAAVVDVLTGLGNRRHLNESLEKAFKKARRKPLAVVMIDTDSFKLYNDLYGHPQGDACLRAIAGALQGGLLRRDDQVLRYGGEEFVVLLPDTEAAAAVQIAERLRLAVRGLGLRHAGRQEGFVTVSLGVAATDPALAIGSAADLLEAADKALYRAKRLGRDRTVCHTDPESDADNLPPPQLRLVSDTVPRLETTPDRSSLRLAEGGVTALVTRLSTVAPLPTPGSGEAAGGL